MSPLVLILIVVCIAIALVMLVRTIPFPPEAAWASMALQIVILAGLIIWLFMQLPGHKLLC